MLCAGWCSQGILQGLELHSIYQLTVEFTRALRDAVKQLLRQFKLPEVRARSLQRSLSGMRQLCCERKAALLWCKWVDLVAGSC